MHTPRYRPRRNARLSLTVLGVVFAVLAPSTPAYAEPDPAAVESQIDKAWNELEPTIEQYNKVHGELQANQAKVADLQQKIQPLQLEVDLAMANVGGIAASAYKGGRASTLNAILTSGSPATLADQLTMLNVLVRGQRAQISDVAAARDKYAGDKKVLDALVAQQARQDADLGAKKAKITTQLADLQKLRQQTSGVAATNFKPVACPVDYIPGPGGIAAKKACGLIGKPYIWAAAGPGGYDCSGLTLTAWAAAGVSLRHYTNWQWSDSKPVSRADLQPGDLVFFFKDLHHMGMYVGGGWMVHAPQTGDHVRMAKMDSPSLPIAGFRRPG